MKLLWNLLEIYHTLTVLFNLIKIVKPPENVLFVCKLNQLTNDEDLELIFSRFGNINRYLYY